MAASAATSECPEGEQIFPFAPDAGCLRVETEAQLFSNFYDSGLATGAGGGLGKLAFTDFYWDRPTGRFLYIGNPLLGSDHTGFFGTIYDGTVLMSPEQSIALMKRDGATDAEIAARYPSNPYPPKNAECTKEVNCYENKWPEKFTYPLNCGVGNVSIKRGGSDHFECVPVAEGHCGADEVQWLTGRGRECRPASEEIVPSWFGGRYGVGRRAASAVNYEPETNAFWFDEHGKIYFGYNEVPAEVRQYAMRKAGIPEETIAAFFPRLYMEELFATGALEYPGGSILPGVSAETSVAVKTAAKDAAGVGLASIVALVIKKLLFA